MTVPETRPNPTTRPIRLIDSSTNAVLIEELFGSDDGPHTVVADNWWRLGGMLIAPISRGAH